MFTTSFLQCRDPFTKSQQEALKRTVKSLFCDSDHMKGRHALLLSHSSGRKSHHHRESAEYLQVHKHSHCSPVPPSKYSRHSPITSSTSAESSTSSSPSLFSSSNDSTGQHHKGHPSCHWHHTHLHRHHKHHKPICCLNVWYCRVGVLIIVHIYRKAARTRPITGLDTWLEAWSIYAGVLNQSWCSVTKTLLHGNAGVSRRALGCSTMLSLD